MFNETMSQFPRRKNTKWKSERDGKKSELCLFNHHFTAETTIEMKRWRKNGAKIPLGKTQWYFVLAFYFQHLYFCLSPHCWFLSRQTLVLTKRDIRTKIVLNVFSFDSVFSIRFSLSSSLNSQERIYSLSLACVWETLFVCLILFIFFLSRRSEISSSERFYNPSKKTDKKYTKCIVKTTM